MNNFNQSTETEVVTLKEIILKIGTYFTELKRQWKLILLFVILGLVFGAYKHFTFKPYYQAEYKFIIEKGDGNAGGLNALLGNFGMASGGKLKPEKLYEIAKSTEFAIRLLNTKTGSTFISQDIIEEYKLLDEWSAQNFTFDRSILTETFNFNDSLDLKKANVIKKLKSILWVKNGDEEPLLSIKQLSSKAYVITAKSSNEQLSFDLASSLYGVLHDFFELDAIRKQKESNAFLRFKIDSLKNLQETKIYQIARLEDRSHGVYGKQPFVRKEILTYELMALNASYSTLVKNYELSELQLKNIKPMFLTLEKPFLPLSRKKSNLKKNLFIYAALGVVLALLLIIVRKFYRDTMNT